MVLKLLIDDRERAIIPFFKNEYQDIEIEVKRIQIGDYVIMQDDHILFAIERKSWVDLSASIKDGRTKNIDKLISLREQTGCKILYLIEGKTRNAPTTRFARIPFKSLQSHLDHLTMRDNIFMIYSSNAEDSAARLIEFCTNYLSLNITGGKEIFTDQDEEIVTNGINEMSLLTTTVKKTNLQIIYNLWSQIPNITTKTASLFIDKYHISDLFLGNISKEEISTMRYPNGTIIGKRATKIIAVKDNDNIANYKHYCNILAELPMITKKTAAKILLNVTFNDLLRGELSEAEIENIEKMPGVRIGKTAAANIYKYLVCDETKN
jgi:ERCC4-type nuclease